MLGAHLHEHLGPEGAKLHVTSDVNQALPVTRWVAKNIGSTAARGPYTMPREPMASMLENGTSHYLSRSAVRFKRRKNKRPRSKVASTQKLSVATLSYNSGQSAASSLERAGHGSVVSSPQGNFPR